MTKEHYSPSTQAVSDAAERVCWDWGNLCPASADTIAAAALRAAVDAVLPEGTCEAPDCCISVSELIRADLLAILKELEETK